MIIPGISRTQELSIRMLLAAERRRIIKRVEALIRNECGVGFSLCQ